MTIHLTLPLPPSVNSMYRAVGAGTSTRVVKASRTRLYEEEAGYAILAQKREQQVPPGPLAVIVKCYWPDKRKRDVDNFTKGVIDIISRTLGFDDCRIADLHAYKRVDPEDPRCEVTIRAAA